MSSAGTSGICIVSISRAGSRRSSEGRGLFAEEETPRLSLSYRFNLCALWRESAARADTTGKTSFCVYSDLLSNAKQPHAASSGTFTLPTSLFSLGLHLSSGVLCVRHWRGSARHLLERQTLETGVFDQDVCSAVKVHLRVRNILNNIFDSL